MAYGVYSRQKGRTVYSRTGWLTKNRKGFLTQKDYRFETREQAECYAQKLQTLYGHETKIKEVR